MITKQQLLQITEGHKIKYLDKLYYGLTETCVRYEINTPLRLSHFLGQVIHESGCFYYVEENLSYSAKSIIAVFGKYFKDINEAVHYARNPEKLANKVYSGRMGNSLHGDGYKYRGRGFIQLTGRENYKLASKEFKQNFLSNPDFIKDYPYNCLVAGWFWYIKHLNQFADVDNIEKITRRINGGLNGLNDRIEWTNKCKQILIS